MSSPIPRDAYAIIIGAMKCGTTSLYAYLKGHPEICPAITKEPEFFSERQEHGAQVDTYSDLWSFDSSVHRYALEASTGYTKYPAEPNVPRNIFRYGIRPKFIYIVRNPFDRIASHFNFMRRDEAWRLSPESVHHINTSNYFLQLERYREYFPLRDILVLDFDELRDDPSQLLQRTYRFLGISDGYLPEQYTVEKPVHLPSGLDKRIEKLKLGALYGRIPEPVKQFGKSLLLKARPPATRVLTEEEREIVYNELKESMANLHQVYGIDVRKWGFV